jgi:hypothetical protein
MRNKKQKEMSNHYLTCNICGSVIKASSIYCHLRSKKHQEKYQDSNTTEEIFTFGGDKPLRTEQAIKATEYYQNVRRFRDNRSDILGKPRKHTPEESLELHRIASREYYHNKILLANVC